MISHRYKCIFVEVPKTGSTSVRGILGKPPIPHLNIWQIKREMENSWTYYGGTLHRVVGCLYGMLSRERRRAIGSGQFESYLKFGFVRNPWDRTVSLYNRKEGLQLRKKMTFEKFVEWIDYSSSTCIHSMPHKNQLDWFVDPHGNVMVDIIGKFENLEEDWTNICEKLHINEVLPHKKRNPLKLQHYKEYYSQKTRDIIAEKFKIDIERFGYKFGE